jgi:D-sedoheptulose 7-phosphate isomerase
MKNFFEPGDLVIGISGSGNSENVLCAVQYAKRNGGYTIGLSGFSGGSLSKIANISLVAGSEDMQKVEDAHLIIVHMIMQAVHGALHDSEAATDFMKDRM